MPRLNEVQQRTFAWLSRSRRLARDYERLPDTGEAMIRAGIQTGQLARALTEPLGATSLGS